MSSSMNYTEAMEFLGEQLNIAIQNCRVQYPESISREYHNAFCLGFLQSKIAMAIQSNPELCEYFVTEHINETR